MGDPKRFRKKYAGPSHPWQEERIAQERVLKKNYGLKNKKEIWKMSSQLKGYKKQVKTLSASQSSQAEKERKQLLQSLINYGILEQSSSLSSILDLPIESIMERRLQTILQKKGLARTISQARQFIVHGHVAVGPKVVTSPSYLVRTAEEPLIVFAQRSSLTKEDHPERIALPPKKKKRAPEERQDRQRGRRDRSRRPRR